MTQSTQAADPQTTTIHKTFEYRIRPNAKFIAACEVELEHSRQIYNAALEERISCYKLTGKMLSKFEQFHHLADARTLPEVKAHLSTIQRDSIERVDEAFKAFFKRCKKGTGKAGFPRFKGCDRYHTFSQKYEAERACPLKSDKLKVPGVGFCRVRLSRPMEGRCVQLRITRRADGWYALLVCELAKPEALPATGLSVGIDVGLTSFATLSNGEKIENPRFVKHAAENLAKLQRCFCKKKRDSNNRRKARHKVALAYLKVARARKHFHYETAAMLVKKFDAIAVEDLNIKAMVKNHDLAKSISDVAWSAFFLILKTKAENAGRVFKKVAAAYTSQDCSECGHRQKMPLKVRVYDCGGCGHKLDRDENAANNIKVRLSEPNLKARGEAKANLRSGNVIVETSASPVRTERVAFSHLRR